MLKPKHISIKKISEIDRNAEKQPNCRQPKSRKSLNPPKRNPSSKQSPIEIIKRKTQSDYHNQSENDHSDFIACINGYLHQLNTEKSRSKNSQCYVDVNEIKGKIKKQKLINRQLQKNILNFQKILCRRTEKLEKLEEAIQRIDNKENMGSLGNSTVQSRTIASKKQSARPITLVNCDSEDSSNLNSSSSEQYNFDKYRRRRRTQIPQDIERMISKTMGLRTKGNQRKR